MEVVGLQNAIFNGIYGSLVLIGEYCDLGLIDCWMLSCHEVAEKGPILDVFVPKEDSIGHICHVAIRCSCVGREERILPKGGVSTISLYHFLRCRKHMLGFQRCNEDPTEEL